MAIVAFSAGSGDLLGVARYAAEPNRARAEYGVLVRSDLKGLGLGWTLMEHLIAQPAQPVLGNCTARSSPTMRPC